MQSKNDSHNKVRPRPLRESNNSSHEAKGELHWKGHYVVPGHDVKRKAKRRGKSFNVSFIYLISNFFTGVQHVQSNRIGVTWVGWIIRTGAKGLVGLRQLACTTSTLTLGW
jgi:hypothetical protein